MMEKKKKINGDDGGEGKKEGENDEKKGNESKGNESKIPKKKKR